MKRKTFFNFIFSTLLILVVITTMVSCSEIVNEEDITDSKVVLISPSEASILNTSKVQFLWEDVYGATSYRLQVFYPDLSQVQEIVLDTLISESAFQYVFNNLEEQVLYPYQWRVKARNFAYETDYQTRNFSILLNSGTGFVNQQVVLTAPAQNLITHTESQNLSWDAIDGATDYRIRIWKPDSSGSLELDTNTATTSINYTFPEGSFQWQVRAQNNSQNTEYSSRNLTVDTTVPNKPVLQSPQQNAELSAGTVSFSWQRTTVTGSEESDSLYVYSDAGLTQLVLKDNALNLSYSSNLTAGAYYWRVRSFDAAGNIGDFSSTFSFIVK